ncbi:DUF815 domain-containing protein [Lonsdalea quercina]|uniref:DUF815 domain-containing protein n=1 Tax=Lonsdalea quercina TaxID=71657 RepID=UPI003974DBEE
MTPPDIILDLSRPLSDLQFNTTAPDNREQLLQKDAKEQIEKLIDVFHHQAKNIQHKNYDEFNPQRSNNTIFIHGERGAGKTTFLRATLNYYNNQKHQEVKVRPIPLIDPTLIETHQHILVDIITKFVRLFDSELKCCQDEKKYQQFRSRLDEMAEGLQLLNTKDQNKLGHSDAAWFLDRALNKATSGQDLERRFHQLLDTMSEILGVDLFLIAIDDVDTQTSKADEVLEVLRCYLTHPKLVVLISGDLKLYSHIIRSKKDKELQENSIRRRDENNKDELVCHLEQQYLTKVLPIEQRIQLKKLDELSKKNKIYVKHQKIKKILENDFNLEIRKLIKTILSDALNIRNEHLQFHLDFILSQPVRTVLQLLKTMIDGATNTDKQTKKETEKWLNITFHPIDFKKAIYQNFIGSLVDEDLKLDNLAQFQPHINSIGYELFKVLHEHGELETGFYARPDSSYDQSGYNATKLYLSATMATQLSSQTGESSISNALKLMMSSGASANIFQTYVTNNLKDSCNEHDYLNYIGLSRNENNITSLCSHFSPIVLDQYNPNNSSNKNSIKKGILSGVIRTPRSMGASTRTKFEKFLKYFQINEGIRIKTLSSLRNNHESFKDNDDLKNYIAAKAVLFSSHCVIAITEGRDYISAYGLLAAIAELLDTNKSKKENIILRKLHNLTNLNTYSYPMFLKGQDTGSEDTNDDNEDDSEKTFLDSDDFSCLMKKWVENTPKSDFSSLLIGKIWTRIHYTLNQISESARGKITYNTNDKNDIVLGVLFSRFIWSIINSSLIEECRYSKGIDEKFIKSINNAKNTNESPRELIKNIDSLTKNQIDWGQSLPLTYSLVSCPLLWPFLGEYKNGKGEESKDLFDKIKLILNDDETFEKIAEHSEPSKLKISALPIMGCFKD